MNTNKQILIALMLTVGLIRPALAMEPSQEELNQQLFKAACFGKVTEAEKLLAAGAHVNALTNMGGTMPYYSTPLMAAANGGYAQICELLIENGADVNIKNEDGLTPLMIAAFAGSEQVCKVLIDHDADMNIQDPDGITALISAIRGEHEPVYRLLIARGANVNAQWGDGGLTALMMAVVTGQLPLCTLLLENGADANVQTANERTTPLMTAAGEGHGPVCTLLITHGANINTQDIDGWTALMHAVNDNQIDACALLLERGADLSIQNEDGDTPLMLATNEGNGQLCRMLIPNAIFNPIRTKAEINASSRRTVHALCALKILFPTLPRDLKHKILASDDDMWNDACNSPFNIHKNQHERVPFMPLQVVNTLIKNNMLKLDNTLAVITAHHYARLRPIIEPVFQVLQTNGSDNESSSEDDEIEALLNPDNLEENFGNEIRANIQRRLGLPQPAVIELDLVADAQDQLHEQDDQEEADEEALRLQKYKRGREEDSN